MTEIARLLEIMARLRDPESGCLLGTSSRPPLLPIAPHTIEEAYEVADAIQNGDMEALKDELGDLLLQVVFHTQMAAEAGVFDFNDVARSISDKLWRRHPHVFGDASVDGASGQTIAWEAQKAAERKAKQGRGQRRCCQPRRFGRGHRRPSRPDPGCQAAETRRPCRFRLAGRLVGARQVHGGSRGIGQRDRRGRRSGAPCRRDGRPAVHLRKRREEARYRPGNRAARRQRPSSRSDSAVSSQSLLAAQGRGPEDAHLDELEALWHRAKTAD